MKPTEFLIHTKKEKFHRRRLECVAWDIRHDIQPRSQMLSFCATERKVRLSERRFTRISFYIPLNKSICQIWVILGVFFFFFYEMGKVRDYRYHRTSCTSYMMCPGCVSRAQCVTTASIMFLFNVYKIKLFWPLKTRNGSTRSGLWHCVVKVLLIFMTLKKKKILRCPYLPECYLFTSLFVCCTFVYFNLPQKREVQTSSFCHFRARHVWATKWKN